jgi:hypothetical protein
LKSNTVPEGREVLFCPYEGTPENEMKRRKKIDNVESEMVLQLRHFTCEVLRSAAKCCEVLRSAAKCYEVKKLFHKKEVFLDFVK